MFPEHELATWRAGAVHPLVGDEAMDTEMLVLFGTVFYILDL